MKKTSPKSDAITLKAAAPKSKSTAQEKQAKPSAVKPATDESWRSIHVFGYGVTQLMGKGIRNNQPNDKLKALEPLIAHLAGLQQKGTKVSISETHSLNIFNGSFIDYRPKPGKNKPQRFMWVDLDPKIVGKLAAELTKTAEASTSGAGNRVKDLLESIAAQSLQNRKSSQTSPGRANSSRKTSVKKAS